MVDQETEVLSKQVIAMFAGNQILSIIYQFFEKKQLRLNFLMREQSDNHLHLFLVPIHSPLELFQSVDGQFVYPIIVLLMQKYAKIYSSFKAIARD
jgi:hypothetical protein